MDNENHKKTWNNFTKFVLWGSVAVVLVLILMAIFLLQMKIGSISENRQEDKRVAITPDIIKKYKSLGFEINLVENYAYHLGIKDEEYKSQGVKILDSKRMYNSQSLERITVDDVLKCLNF